MHRRGACVTRSLLGCLVAALSTVSAAWAQGPAFLVKDINSSPPVREPYEDEPSSYPRDFVALDGIVYFVAGDNDDTYGEGPNGVELWRSDGTPAGTALVADIMPGISGSNPTGLQAWDGALYFLAEDSARGIGLWRSDGTAAGTALVAATGWSGRATALARLGDTWLFLLTESIGTRLWRVDAAGARVIAHVSTYPYDTSPGGIVVGDSVAYFVATHADNATALFRTDGTEAGTAIVPGPNPGLTSPHNLTAVGDAAFFVANDGVHGEELWRADQQGAVLVADVLPGQLGSWPMGLTPFSDGVLFAAGGVDEQAGLSFAGLWRSDGTGAGTELIVMLPDRPYAEQPFQSLGGTLYFGAGPRLWRTDGTAQGTAIVHAFPIEDGYYGAVAVAASGDQLLCLFDSEDSDMVELWRSDGTAQGVALVKEFRWVTDRYFASIHGATAGDGSFVFAADGGSGMEPWRSDGTADGTVLLAEINPGATDIFDEYSAISAAFADLDGTLVFLADDRENQSYLWQSDGSASGTSLIPGAVTEQFYTSSLMPVGERLYYSMYSPEAGNELWELASLDGPGQLVADIHPGTNGSYLEPFAVLDGELILAADDGQHGMELWAPYDEGLLFDIEPGPASSYPREPTVLNGVLYFLTASGAIWRTNATAAGTAPVAPVAAGYDARMVASSNRLAIATSTTGLGALWFSDGSPQGTTRIADLAPVTEAESTFARLFAFAGDTLVFSAGDGLHGIELWRSDGTFAGTELLVDISPGPASSSPDAAVSRGDAVFFFADDGVHGREPWVTDGTPAGTHLVADIRPGLLSSHSRSEDGALRVGDVFVFAASDSADGLELWRSDGTAAGTAPVQDIAPGACSSSPQHFTISGEHLFFTANDNQHGRELWALPLSETGCTRDCPDPSIPTPTPRRTPRAVWTPGPPLPTLTPTVTVGPRTTAHCEQAGDGDDCVFLTIGSATAVPGERVEIEVTMRSGGLPVAGVQLDMYDDVGLQMALRSDGMPDCRVNPDIGKDASAFRFLWGEGSAVRALVISIVDTNPLPAEALLFTCAYEVALDATPGSLPLRCENFLGSDPHGVAIPPADEADNLNIGEMVCSDGVVTVVAPTPAPTGTPVGSLADVANATGGGGGCQIEAGGTASHALLLFLPPLLVLMRRRRG